jgi:mitochondrial fission protein ELM1
LALQLQSDSCNLAILAWLIYKQLKDTTAGVASPPLTWVLTGHKAGDNTQVLALAEALGWPFEVKRFSYRSFELLSNRLLGTTLAGIDRRASSDLQPPWPALIISAGRRNEPVARWIQRQSGGRTRLVHVGRPWAPLDVFDLIVTTPQYFLPDQDNILENHLPMHAVSKERLEAAAASWRAQFEGLQRPYTAVLVGGNSGPFVFTKEKGARLGRLVNELVVRTGGSALVSDSARTPATAFAAFQSQLTVPAYIYRWNRDDADNPYFAYLALADQLVVTGESMSMLSEASVTCKPLFIFDPADARPWWRCAHNFRFKPLSHRLAMCIGPRRMRRDVGNIQRQLVASGGAVWLGESFPPGRQPAPPDDAQRAAERVRALFDG